MKKVYESKKNGWDESVEVIHIYELDDVEELHKLESLSHEELLEEFDFSEYDYVMPGQLYYRYNFEFSYNFAIVVETIALNV